MQLTRILPTPAQLAAKAISGTAFVAEIVIGASVTTCAELCAELAAEAWETERGTIIGATISSDVTSATALILAEQADVLRHAKIEALYAADADLERSIATITKLRNDVFGDMPLVSAADAMEGIEDDLDAAVAKLKAAALIVGIEIDRAETAASRRRALAR